MSEQKLLVIVGQQQHCVDLPIPVAHLPGRRRRIVQLACHCGHAGLERGRSAKERVLGFGERGLDLRRGEPEGFVTPGGKKQVPEQPAGDLELLELRRFVPLRFGRGDVLAGELDQRRARSCARRVQLKTGARCGRGRDP